MADAAVDFLLEKADDFLRKELQLSEEINGGVSTLRGELEKVKALLKDADNGQGEHNFQVDLWLKNVRDVACDIEDVLEVFAIHILRPGHSTLLRLPFTAQWRSLHTIDDRIKDGNTKLKKTREGYVNITTTCSAQASTSSITGIAPFFMDDADVVGIEEPMKKLISWATDHPETQSLKVVFVVGMGGSGKTVLATKVFDRVKKYFDCHALITLSNSKNKLELLWTIFNQICNPIPEPAPCSFSQFDEVDLIRKVKRHLQDKRYVLFFDNLWIKSIWESIRHALPRANRGRVIITTRRGDIAFSCRDNSTDHVYELQPLPAEAAQQLFYRTTFRPDGRCPSGLQTWSQTILERCQGLPLGIIEIGRLLSNKERIESEWKLLHDSLESQLKENGPLSNIMRVLSVSYNDLPYHLKYCFLYLSIFPGDYPVKRRRLIRLWIAEGLIIKDAGKEVEDVGEDYLKELIERSLIQVSEFDFDGKPRSCRVHHLMHKIILSKAGEENFCTVLTKLESNFDKNTRRRLSIQNGGHNMPCWPNFTEAKARTFFAPGTPYCSVANIPSSLKLLRVLHLEGASLRTFPMEILELLLLKYLCLSNTNIKSIPNSLGDLRLLETLDLKQTRVTKLPKEILKLDNLRHLLVYRYDVQNYTHFDCVKGFKVSATIRTPNLGKLQNLQKLAFIKADRHPKMIHGLGNLTQLRKLGIIDLPSEEGENLCHSIKRLRNLRSLNITSLRKEDLLDLHAINGNPPPFLRRLYLKGRLEKFPTWISILHDLGRIRLKWSGLDPENNPIQHLQDLPNLLELQLLDAYFGIQLDFNTRKFQKLKILELEQLGELTMVKMEKGTLPHLQKLIIRKCKKLKQVPMGIDNLTHLKELHLYDMPDHFVSQIRNDGELHHLVHHIPHIHCYYLPNDQGNWKPEYLGIACKNIYCPT